MKPKTLKSSKSKLGINSSTSPKLVTVTIDVPPAVVQRLEKMARRHGWQFDHLVACAVGFIAFHGDVVLREVFAGGARTGKPKEVKR